MLQLDRTRAEHEEALWRQSHVSARSRGGRSGGRSRADLGVIPHRSEQDEREDEDDERRAPRLLDDDHPALHTDECAEDAADEACAHDGGVTSAI